MIVCFPCIPLFVLLLDDGIFTLPLGLSASATGISCSLAGLTFLSSRSAVSCASCFASSFFLSRIPWARASRLHPSHSSRCCCSQISSFSNGTSRPALRYVSRSALRPSSSSNASIIEGATSSGSFSHTLSNDCVCAARGVNHRDAFDFPHTSRGHARRRYPSARPARRALGR